MKNVYKALIGGGTVALVGVAIYLFTVFNTVHEKLIPTEADFVMSVNIADLTENSGLTDKDVTKKIKELMDDAPSDVSELYESVFKDPKELGIRLDKPIYMWGCLKTENVGLAAAIFDAGKFKKALQKIAEKTNTDIDFVKDENITWVKDKGSDEHYAIAYTDDCLICCIGEKSKSRIRSWLELEKSEQYCTTDRFKRLEDMDGQLKIDFYLSKKLMDFLADNDRDFRKSMEELDMRNMECGYVSGLNVEKGSVELITEAYSDNEEIKTLLTDMPGLNDISDTYTSTVPENFVFWCGMNIDAKEYFEGIKRIKPLKDCLNLIKDKADINIEKMLKDIDGDLSFHIANISESMDNIDVTLRVKVKDDGFVAGIVNKFCEVGGRSFAESYRKEGKDSYVIVNKKSHFNYDTYNWDYTYEDAGVFGQDGGTAYISTLKRNRTMDDKTNALKSYMDDIKSSKMFAVFNPEAIVSLLKKDIHEGRPNMNQTAIYNALKNIKDITLSYKSGTRVALRCNFIDSSATLSKAILSIAEETMSQIKRNRKRYEEAQVEEDENAWEDSVAVGEYDWEDSVAVGEYDWEDSVAVVE